MTTVAELLARIELHRHGLADAFLRGADLAQDAALAQGILPIMDWQNKIHVAQCEIALEIDGSIMPVLEWMEFRRVLVDAGNNVNEGRRVSIERAIKRIDLRVKLVYATVDIDAEPLNSERNGTTGE